MGKAQVPESKPNLTKAVAIAKRVAKDFKSLSEMLGHPKKINRYQRAESFIELVDDLDNIKRELIAKSDGRPQPFALPGRFSVPADQRDQYPPEEIEKWAAMDENLLNFGHCHDPGYSHKAIIGEMEFTKAELLRFRNWIDSVIKWQDANPKKTKGL